MYKMNQEIVIDRQEYIILGLKEFKPFDNPSDVTRTILTLRKPRGKRHYQAVVYENGSISSVV